MLKVAYNVHYFKNENECVSNQFFPTRILPVLAAEGWWVVGGMDVCGLLQSLRLPEELMHVHGHCREQPRQFF